VSITNLFELTDSDTVWDAWLTTVILLDMLEQAQEIRRYYDFDDDAPSRIGKIYSLAEAHAIDKRGCAKCSCYLPNGEHPVLKLK
jgi:hypothetical protein